MRKKFAASSDRALVQIVDVALADVTQRAGKWLACGRGCTQCCIGVFSINQLDVWRLRKGLAELERNDPKRAARLRDRARDAVRRLSADFPGDPESGLLDEGEEAERQFFEFANQEACPVLDPETGDCELYEWRPMTCRVFGPPVPTEGGLGMCELCFQGATNEEISACELRPDPEDLESKLVRQVERASGVQGNTIVPFGLTVG